MTFPAPLSGRQGALVPGSYNRQLRGVDHTWAFKGNVLGMKYKDGTYVTAEEIRRFAASAVEQWCEAANQEGLRLRFTEVGIYDQAEIKIYFAPYNGMLGSTVGNYIEISDSGHAWPQRLETTILHEMGHMILGGGHHGEGVMSQRVGAGHPSVVQTRLSPAERRWVLELYNPRVKFTVANVFGNGSFGGRVLVDSVEKVVPANPGVLEFDSERASTFPHTLTAVNRQTSGEYVQEFDCWGGSGDAQCVSLKIDTVNNARYEARFRNVYNLLLENEFAGSKGPGFVKLNSNVINLPWPQLEVLQGKPVLLEALDQPNSCLLYRFSSWSDGSKTNPRVLDVAGHSTLTARYAVSAPMAPPDVRSTGAAGECIRVVWKEHPHPGVTAYKITRRTKGQNGKPAVAENVAVVERPETSWTDARFTATGSFTDEVVVYGVQSYYAPTSRYSTPEFVQVFGKRAREDVTGVPDPPAGVVPARFEFSHYPDPSKGTTWIVLQLPHQAQITIEVFDVLGRRIRTIVNEQVSEGSHTFAWHGSADSGVPVASGLYFCRVLAQANVDGRVEPILATRRLVVMR